MAKVFLDTKTFIDIVGKRGQLSLDDLKSHAIYISPLSFHIYCYIYKIDVQKSPVSLWLKKFTCVNLTKSILTKALSGPTSDLEDNIQLHSSAEAEADYFITRDKNLLDMKFFGKAEIAGRIE